MALVFVEQADARRFHLVLDPVGPRAVHAGAGLVADGGEEPVILVVFAGELAGPFCARAVEDQANLVAGLLGLLRGGQRVGIRPMPSGRSVSASRITAILAMFVTSWGVDLA